MILTRLGNKRAIANKIIPHFPKHTTYIEPFFGAGGLFFYKPLAKYNIVNDLDSDVFNLYMVVLNQKEELLSELARMPAHQDLIKYWKKNQETNPVLKAVRFLLLSNFTFLGTGDTLRICNSSNKKTIIENRIDETQNMLKNVMFSNNDACDFLMSISFMEKNNSFIYLDPPYIDTRDNYSHSFTKQDSIRIFDCLDNLGVRFAMSEFNNDFIIEQANDRGLNVIEIGERKSLKNRSVEILVTNYDKANDLFNYL